MTRYQIVYWRDIPVHVKVRDGRTRQSRPLSPRFQETVHRAAYRAKAIHGDAYMSGWTQSDWQDQDDSTENVIRAVVQQIEAAYGDDRLDRLARQKGYETND